MGAPVIEIAAPAREVLRDHSGATAWIAEFEIADSLLSGD